MRPAANGEDIANLSFGGGSNNANTMIVSDAVGYQDYFENLIFQAGSNGNDYSTREIIWRGNPSGSYGTFNNHMSNILFLDLGPNTSPNDTTPSVYFSYAGCVMQASKISMARRGFLIRPPQYGCTISIDQLYSQGNSTPIIFVYGDSGGTPGIGVDMKNIIFDTTAQAGVANLYNTNMTLRVANSNLPSSQGAWTNGPNIVTTGVGPTGTTGTISGINTNFALDGTFGTSSTTGYPQQKFNTAMALGQGYPFFTMDSPGAAPTCSVATAPPGPPYSQARTWTMVYAPIYPNGGEGSLSLQAVSGCTSDGTTQQVTYTAPAAIPGATSLQWYYNNAGNLFGANCSSSTLTTCVVSVSNGVSAPGLTAGGQAGIKGQLAWSNIFDLGQYIDTPEETPPANPATGYQRWFPSNVTHKFACLTSTGGDCSPSPSLYVQTFTGDSTASLPILARQGL